MHNTQRTEKLSPAARSYPSAYNVAGAVSEISIALKNVRLITKTWIAPLVFLCTTRTTASSRGASARSKDSGNGSWYFVGVGIAIVMRGPFGVTVGADGNGLSGTDGDCSSSGGFDSFSRVITRAFLSAQTPKGSCDGAPSAEGRGADSNANNVPSMVRFDVEQRTFKWFVLANASNISKAATKTTLEMLEWMEVRFSQQPQ